MLIDPKGLLHGDRVGACSDEAQLHFPRLLAASNSYGRFRMSVDWMHSDVYGSFRVKPTKEQLTGWLREYHANFLLFVYHAGDGSLWAQWDIPAKLLGSYRLAADRKSPEPPAEELKAFRFSYAESVRIRNQANPDLISDGFGNLPKVSKSFQNISKTSGTFEKVLDDVGVVVGVVVGVDVGVGVVSSPAAPELPAKEDKAEKPTDPRHIPFRDAVHEHWRSTVPDCEAAPWDGSEAKALTNLLRANPNLTVEQFDLCLRHRAESRVQASDRPRRWLETVTDYLSGPKDEFGKPLHGRPRLQPGVHRPDEEEQREAERDAAARRQRDEDLELWRDLKQRGSPLYERVPTWAREALEAVSHG